jgi:predicted kinase
MENEALKTIYLLRGIPGTGKSALAEDLAYNSGGVALAADDFPSRYLLNGDLNPAHSHKEAHDWFHRELQKLIDDGVTDIILHNTFVDMKSIFPVWLKAQKHNYALQVIHCEALIFPDGEQAKSTKNVPASVIEKMKAQWQKYSLN